MAIRYLTGVNIDSNTLFVDSANNRVGIGTASPSYKLDVTSDIRIGEGLRMVPNAGLLYAIDGALSYYSSSNGVYLNGAGTNGWLRLNASGLENDINSINIYGQGAGGYIDFNTGNSTRIRVTNGGNVLIGTTTNAGYKLDVNGTGRFTDALRAARAIINDGANSTDGIKIIGSLTSSAFTSGIEFIRTTVSGGSKIQPLRDIAIGGVGFNFLVTANNTDEINATYTTAAVITNAGNVGIGTTSPGAKLNVAGNLGATVGAGGSAIRLTNTDTGNYASIGAGIVGITNAGMQLSVDGASRMIIDAAGNVLIGTLTTYTRLTVSNGTSTRSGITISDTNTASLMMIAGASAPASISFDSFGLRFVGGSTVGTDNGSEFMRITSGGNVGIGTTAPNSKLDVRGVIEGGDGTIRTVVSYTGSGGVTGTITNHPYILYANNDERMRITAAGNVGIGTTSPVSHAPSRRTLVVSDTVNGANVEIWGDSSGKSILQSVGGNTYVGNLASGGGAGATYITSGNGSTYTTFLANGNVGIGTTAPSSILHIDGIDPFVRINNVNSANNQGIKISYNYSDTHGFHLLYNANSAGAYIDNTYPITSGQPWGDIYFRQNNGTGTMLTRMTIKADGGNVGIGTTSPGALLQVGQASTTTDALIRLSVNYTGTTPRGGIVWHDTSNVTGKIHTDYNGSNMTNMVFGSLYNSGYNSNPLMVIQGNGNVGIGTTSPSNKFVSVNDATFNGENTYSIAAAASSDIGYKTVIGYDYANDIGVISAVRQGIQWKNLSILPVGSTNLGVGTITPSQRLHVAGNLRVTGAYYDSNNEAGTGGQVLTSTASGTDWVTPYTSVATSLYDLLPAARVAYNWTGQVVNDTWVDIFSAANNVLTTGTWMVQMYISDWAQGGQHYTYTYTGTMQWYQETVNQGGESAAAEIYLHRMGHAANASVLYLRTTEMTAVSGGIGKLQVKANYSNTSNTTINFKFVKIF